jgi:hypothetical protein
MSRRDAVRAVLNAVLLHDSTALFNGQLSPRLRQAAMDYRDLAPKDANLNHPAESDLDALNAAVAEAVEAWFDATKKAHNGTPNLDAWRDDLSNIYRAELARRAALAPKLRYEATNETCSIYDRQVGYHVKPSAVAALLNERKP